jgi:predicted metal-binding membrane protein
MAVNRVVESLLKRDRLVVLAGLIVIIALAWGYLISLAAPMNDMQGDMSGMTQLRSWMTADALLTFGMWAAMMIGMMSPSATPMILLYARVCRKQAGGAQPFVPTGVFFLGYIAVWVAFSAVATLLQWGLEQAALLSPKLVSASPLLGALILIAAGVYQWMPTKGACLRHCRSPVEFLATHWRSATRGAFVMGLEHGVYCLGCCWALMLLLFVGGVMNLLWLAAIAVFVLVEKATPFGTVVSRVGAVLFIVAGAAILVAL